MAKDKLICNCNGTMPLDGKALARALKLDGAPRLSSELCRKHIAAFEAAVKKGDDLVVACTQEAPLFGELHEELKGEGGIQFVNDDPAAAITEARKKAMADATAKARTLAEAAGVGLGPVLEISEQSFMPPPMPMEAKSFDRAASAVPIEAGENAYRVQVNVTFALE